MWGSLQSELPVSIVLRVNETAESKRKNAVGLRQVSFIIPAWRGMTCRPRKY